MEFALVFFPAIFVFLISLSDAAAFLRSPIESLTSTGVQSDNSIVSELQDLKLQIARLEAVLEETIIGLNTKIMYLERHEELIVEMGQKIHDLQADMLAIKGESSNTEERLNALEQEVRLLWAASRKNNFDIHVLQSEAQATNHRLEEVELEVQKMDDIVTEYWIQIRHLEQALQAAEMRALNAQRRVEPRKGTFTEFVEYVGSHLHKVPGVVFWEEGSSLKFYESKVIHYFEQKLSAAKMYHRQLQRDIKRHMERHDFTAAFANEEVVFFAASALITFPIIVITNILLGC